jgi:alpha-tubulin suppressor-like RCC1 family protein
MCVTGNAYFFLSLIFAEEGQLYAWGCNTSYELGLGHTNRVSAPQLVTHLEGRVITAVYCGKAHTLATTGNFFRQKY